MSAITVTPSLVRHLPVQGALVEPMTAGEDLTIGDVVYEATDGKVWGSDANAGAPAQNGYAILVESFDGETTVKTGAICSVCFFGPVTGFTGGVKGALGYVSNTKGKIDTATGAFKRILGRWSTDTTFFVQPTLADDASS